MAVFEILNGLNVNEHTEQKSVGGAKLTYLSWPWAWAEVKKAFPDAHYTIWKNADGLPYTVDPKTGYMVYTSVTIEGITHEMWLPVMNGANKAMKPEPYEYQAGNYKKQVEAASMMDINKTIMRCLVKNLAMFGLGLYIYAGEDLPEAEQDSAPQSAPANPVQSANVRPQDAAQQASVSTVDKIPAPQPQAAKPAGNGPEPLDGETPGAFIKRRIADLQAERPDFNFVKARAGLIEGGVIEDIPSAVITMDQAKALIAAIYANFRKEEKAG